MSPGHRQSCTLVIGVSCSNEIKMRHNGRSAVQKANFLWASLKNCRFVVILFEGALQAPNNKPNPDPFRQRVTGANLGLKVIGWTCLYLFMYSFLLALINNFF